ncbi:radical SAM protein [Planctomycetota bacterium]
MRIHRWLDFKVTRRCNNHGHKCEYCAVQVDPQDACDILSLADIHRTMLDARALGFDTYWLLGGEPSLRGDADQLVDPLADDSEITLTIVTNGKQVADAMYRSLFATKAKRACVQVSLDTLAQDNFKRADPGASLGLIAELHRLAEDYSTPSHVCAVQVHCVITRENLGDFDDFARFLAARGIAVSLAMVCPWRLAAAPARFDEFTREEADSVATRTDRLRTGLGVDSFNPIVADFIRARLAERSPAGARTCGAGLTHLVINGDGSVHRCMAESFAPSTSLGNVRTGRLHAILRAVDRPRRCVESTACFDGYAWDRMSLSCADEERS